MSIDGFDLTGRDMYRGLTGQTAAESAERAGQLQYQASKDAIKAQKEFLNTIRGDLAPYRNFGENQLTSLGKRLSEYEKYVTGLGNRLNGYDRRVNGLDSFINDPSAQLDYVQNSPFFSALANDAQNRLLNVQAARGKLGTGDTPAALQNQLLLMGTDLVQQAIANRQQSLGNYQQGLQNRFGAAGLRQNAITNRQSAVSLGQNAAAMTGTATQNAGNSITDLLTGGAASRAAGLVGAGNAQTQGANNMAQAGLTALGIFLSDRRMKCDLEEVGKLNCGIPVYSFRYVGSPQKVVGVMAQDVESVVPGAVLDVFGVKFVDYSELERALKWH